MESPADRLRRAAELSGKGSAADVARAMGERYPTVAGHFNGSRGFRGKAERYAAFFKVDLTWLLTGKGHPRPENFQTRILALSPQGQQTIKDMIELLEEREALRRKAG